MPAREHPGAAPSAARADEAPRPARRRQVVEARGLSREAVLELHDRAREVRTSDQRTVGPAPDGTGYASISLSAERREAVGVGARELAEHEGIEAVGLAAGGAEALARGLDLVRVDRVIPAA